MSRILVTGGAGFIGSHVATHLLDKGHDVHIADRLSYAGKVRNVSRWLTGAKLWIGALQDDEFSNRLAAFGFDVVVHCAANTHVDRSISDPVQFTVYNVQGTNQLLDSIVKSGNIPQKIILYSTDEVYGPTPAWRRFDEQTPFAPSNAYSASKVGVEGLACAYWTTHRLPVMVVRPCNTYGRRQHPEKAIPRFVGQAIRGEPITVHNDGGGSRDWLHTTDHATAIERLIEAGVPGEAYNLAAGDEHTDIEVARKVLELTGSKSDIAYVTGRPGHDRRYWMDGGKLRSLGWAPKMPFGEGFRDAVEWTMRNQDWWAHDYVEGEACRANSAVESAATVRRG